MLPEPRKNEPQPEPAFEYAPNLFEEPRDHANQWDVSAIWVEEQRTVQNPKRGPVLG